MALPTGPNSFHNLWDCCSWQTGGLFSCAAGKLTGMETSDALRQMKLILKDKGVRELLIFLNRLTAHRFTALYRFNDETLENLYFFDRQHPEMLSTPEIPVLASYCVFVRNSGRTFATSDSLSDDRVSGHPKQQEVQSYCGVPLVNDDGVMFGTICHFDFQPIAITDDNVTLMEAVAPMLQIFGNLPIAR